MKAKTTKITARDEQSFFVRGKVIAKQADAAQTIQPQTVLSFEDASDVSPCLTVGIDVLERDHLK